MSTTRQQHSPSRPRINALSPLQSFSPLPGSTPLVASPINTPSVGRSRHGGGGGHSRSNSGSSMASTGTLSRSLSTHERVFTPHARRDNGATEQAQGGVTTRLILVKAPSAKGAVPLRQRSKSSSNLVPATPTLFSNDAPATSARAPRRSFAASFSSLTPMTSAKGVGGVGGGNEENNPPKPPVRRPSIGVIETSRGTQEVRSKLSPDEVLELARGLMSPVAAPEGGAGSLPRPGGGLQRRKSTGSTSRSAHGAAGAQDKDKEPEPIELEPVDYVEMAEDTLLPFSDRPRQVADLLGNPVNADLITLLKHAFPKTPKRPNWKDIDVTKWSWDELYAHLTTIDRRECADYEWVLLARHSVRARGVALWEQLGACLGCDSELITAGEEDETPAAWGGLGLGDEGEYDPTLSRVYIAGLEAVDQDDDDDDDDKKKKQERVPSHMFDEHEEFGAAGAWSDAMATIGERDESPMGTTRGLAHDHEPTGRPGRLESPMGTRTHRLDEDPFASPESVRSDMRRASRDTATSEDSVSPHSPRSPSSDMRSKRTKSFVGLQICTVTSPDAQVPMRSPTIGLGSPPNRLGVGLGGGGRMVAPEFERTPGNPLFVSSFRSLSLGPNLGRKASTGFAQVVTSPGSLRVSSPKDLEDFRAGGRGLQRKTSGAGLSESAITFVSDSSYEQHV